MRNSRHPGGPTLVYTRAEIAAFIAGVRSGEFDDLADAPTRSEVACTSDPRQSEPDRHALRTPEVVTIGREQG